MKISNLVAAAAIILAGLAFVLALKNNSEIKVLKKQLSQFSTTTSFSLQSLDSGRAAYDSVIFIHDTAFFYKKGKFLGKMYSSTEGGVFFSISKGIEALKNSARPHS